MSNEYKKGYAAGLQDENGVNLDHETKDFVKGFCQACRDVDNLADNADIDSLDY